MAWGGSRRRHRRPRVWAAFFFLVAIGVAVAASAQATTVLFLGGTGGSLGRLFPPGLFGSPGQLLGGAYANDPVTTVDYPASLWPVTGPLDHSLGYSVGEGAANAEAMARTSQGPLVIVGTSQGAVAAQRAEAELDSDPGVPSSTTFILIADPNLGLLSGLQGRRIPILNYTPAALPETRFTTIVVTNEYDGFADPIRRPWNLLTDLNALMGIVYVHPTAHNTSLADVPAADITTTTNDRNGTTIVYRVPTKRLPLTMPLRQLGVPDGIVDGIDARLRPIIDEGYRDPGPKVSPRHLPRPAAGSRAPARVTRSAGDATADGAVGRGIHHRPHLSGS